MIIITELCEVRTSQPGGGRTNGRPTRICSAAGVAGVAVGVAVGVADAVLVSVVVVNDDDDDASRLFFYNNNNNNNI
jgi:hypothetical protein